MHIGSGSVLIDATADDRFRPKADVGSQFAYLGWLPNSPWFYRRQALY